MYTLGCTENRSLFRSVLVVAVLNVVLFPPGVVRAEIASPNRALAVTAQSEVPANERLKITIDQARKDKSLLAIAPFGFFGNPALHSNYKVLGADLYRVIVEDLETSSFFSIVSPESFFEKPGVGLKPNTEDPKGFKFSDWSSLATQFLVRGAFVLVGDDIEIEMHLYHVPGARRLLQKTYRGKRSDHRRLLHNFADDLLNELTGAPAFFASRLLFASDRVGNQWKEIFVSDWDTQAANKITDHKSVALSPTWSADGQKVAYSAFAQRSSSKLRNADLFLYELNTKRRWHLSYRPGLNTGPSFFPDGESLVLTLSNVSSSAAGTDLFRLGLDGRVLDRLTDGPRGALNVEAAVSPDGKKIAFSSDRGGKPMIWITDANGKNQKTVTTDAQLNSTPSWSPDGKSIAFARQERGNFDVFTLEVENPKGTLRRITSASRRSGASANNEDPSFSPCGRYLVYTSDRTGAYQIYVSTADGREEHQITNDKYNYYKPHWSPRSN